ncbi:MAG TPA: DUF1573 domain-containing protein, partial [Thermoanaerobaculia bacterium]|nr:DUF1573 domain-containing protein [Thermoanaerobaculia bacterium]
MSGLGGAPSAAPHATVRVDRFDFGTVRRGEAVVHAFSVHNSGTGPLAFTKAELSMPGMSCRISPPIAPGGDGTILLEWKTAHVQGAAEGIAEIATNDPERPSLRLSLTGRIEGPLEIDPLPAIFLSAFRGEDVRRELTIRAHVAGPVSLSLAAPAG